MKLLLELALLGALVFMPFIVIAISHLSPQSPFALLFIAVFAVAMGVFLGWEEN